MNVGHSLLAFTRVWVFSGRHSPVLLAGDRIDGNFAHIAFTHELIQRLRQLAFVSCKLVNEFPHLRQVVAQHSFTRVQERLLKLRERNGSKDDDDRDHDHQLEERKSPGKEETGGQGNGATGAKVSASPRLLFSPSFVEITNHCTALHLALCLSTSSAHQKHFPRPTKLSHTCRNTNEGPTPTYRSLDRSGPLGGKLSSLLMTAS